MGYDFEIADQPSQVFPLRTRSQATLRIDDHPVRALLEKGALPGEHFLEIDGIRERVFIATQADTHFIHFRGKAYRVDAINALERARRAAEPARGDETIRAPMPGTVVRVVAQVGDHVDAGALLLTIESMKLETSITAPHDARVAEMPVSEGATFDQGAALVRLEKPEDENGEESK